MWGILFKLIQLNAILPASAVPLQPVAVTTSDDRGFGHASERIKYRRVTGWTEASIIPSVHP